MAFKLHGRLKNAPKNVEKKLFNEFANKLNKNCIKYSS